MIDFCKNCGNKRMILNVKYHLCQKCNQDRLEGQKNSKGLKSRLNSPTVKKTAKKSKIRAISKAESKNKKKLIQIYEEIDNERDHICEGCGQSEFLSHSHLISQSRKDLQCEKENIILHCMERITPDKFGNLGCHQRWESGQLDKIKTLKNYKIHLDYLMRNDFAKFIKIGYDENEK